MKALGCGLALVLVATLAWGQDHQRPAADAFSASWAPEADPVDQRIKGSVHNGSRFRVTDVRLQVVGLDGSSRPVGQTFTWAFGDIAPDGETSFAIEAIPGAVSYQISVVSYDVVTGPPARE